MNKLNEKKEQLQQEFKGKLEKQITELEGEYQIKLQK